MFSIRKKAPKNRGFLCPERDSNPHAHSDTWPSTMPVYQFQHSDKLFFCVSGLSYFPVATFCDNARPAFFGEDAKSCNSFLAYNQLRIVVGDFRVGFGPFNHSFAVCFAFSHCLHFIGRKKK